MTTQAKNTSLIIAIVFVTIVACFITSLYFSHSSLNDTITQDLEFAISIADELVSAKMNLMKSEASVIAERLNPAIPADYDGLTYDEHSALVTLMREQYDAHPDVVSLSIFDRNGTLASYSIPPHEHDIDVNADYMDLVYGGAAIISSPFYCSTKGEFVINVYAPLREERVLAATMPGLVFSDLLADHKLWKSGEIFMINEAGMFIGAADREIVLALENYIVDFNETSDSTYEEVSRLIETIMTSDNGVEIYNFGGEEHICAFSSIDSSALGWRVAVTAPSNESPQSDVRRALTYAAALILLIGAAASFFISRVIARPFRRIESQNRALEKLNKTIQKQADTLLNEHERIKLMLDSTPLACRLWNRDFDMLDCNEAAVKLFGLRDKQEYMDRFFDLTPEHQPNGQFTRDKIRETISEAFEKGKVTQPWMYATKDGEPIPAETTMVRVPYGDDYVVAAYSRDLREQKKMLDDIERRDFLLQTINRSIDQLLRSEPDAFQRTLRDSMGMLARAIGADSMYIYRNYYKNGSLRRARLCEWNADDPRSYSARIDEDLSYDDDAPHVCAALARGESVRGLTRNLPEPDREWFASRGVLAFLIIPAYVQGKFWGVVGFGNALEEYAYTENEESVLRSGGLLVASALLRNEYMTGLRDTMAQLEGALSDAESANAAKSDFLAHMSHEIRTPLNAIIGLSELTIGEEDLSVDAEANLEKIYGAGATILSIVNDILDISKIESGKMVLFPTQYDTPSLINDVVTLNIVRIGEKSIDFKLFIEEGFPSLLIGDDLRVRQIFNNLLSNAFKYTKSGSVEWRLSYVGRGDDAYIVSSVKDTGIGIREEDISRLYSDYNQLDAKANRNVQGTGLGLAITKRLLDLMDGSIDVKSKYGEGSVFTVKIKQGRASDAPISRDVAKNLTSMRYTLSKRGDTAKLAHIDLSYASVLVVDDIATNLDVVKGMMKPYRMRIDCATSGAQAIEMVKSMNPIYSAIFMDHMMPGMDGIEATRQIRENIGTQYAKTVPIIALTANAIVGNEQMFLTQGFQAFISKPIDMQKLDSTLRRLVRDKKLEKKIASQNADKTSSSADAQSASKVSNSADAQRAPDAPDLKIEGIDVVKALGRFNGDMGDLTDVLRSYAVNTRQLLTDLDRELAENDLVNYSITVHGVKGSSYGIMATATGQAAETLESLSKSGDIEALKLEHAAFKKRVAKLINRIDEALDSASKALEAQKPIEARPDRETLVKLKEACKAFDMDSVDELMKRLDSAKYESGGKLIDRLRAMIESMDFEAVAAVDPDDLR